MVVVVIGRILKNKILPFIVAGDDTNNVVEKENMNDEAGEEHTDKAEDPVEDEGDAKVAKKKKPKKKGKASGGLKQTNPPTLPISQLFPDGKLILINLIS